MAEVIVVVGGQWGDEGKGKIVDFLAATSDIIIRPQGGDNAGHTVINGQGEFAFHSITSGISNPDATCIAGSDMALNPVTLIREMSALEMRGVNLCNFRVSQKAHLTLPYHIYLDRENERARSANGKEIGTTQRGIGPTYVDKVAREGIRAGELKNPRVAREHLETNLAGFYSAFPEAADDPEYSPEKHRQVLQDAINVLAPIVVDTEDIIYQALEARNARILIEGAQGTLLDVTHGVYPYVTSSSTTVDGLLSGSGIPARYLTKAIGVFKAYQTRVGSGSMPTEMLDRLGQMSPQGYMIQQNGHEFGTTTGRERRIGHFDGNASRYSQRINGFTDIALTRLDTLSSMGEMKICGHYRLGGEIINYFPTDDETLSRCRPVYTNKTYSWNGEFSGARDIKDLPWEVRFYCDDVMQRIPGARLSYIGVGPQREALIELP